MSAQQPVPAAGVELGSLSYEELSSLKDLANKSKQKWYRDYAFLISLLAFLLSLSTSIISAYIAHQRDIHDRQAELAVALATIQDLNLKQIELHDKYANTPYESQASGLINNEVSGTLHTASKLALQLKDNATTADLVGIAQGLYGLSENETAHKLFEYALKAAQNANDKSVALRDLGWYLIRSGRGGATLKEGEDDFSEAYALDHEYDLSQQPGAVVWLRANAQLGWAGAIAPVDCPSARSHFNAGMAVLLTAPSTIDFDQMRVGAKQQWIVGIGGIAACMPDPGTPRPP